MGDERPDREELAVLADELQKQGDPHGELIALQLAEPAPDRDERITELQRSLFGPLPRGLRLQWDAGFVRVVELSGWPDGATVRAAVESIGGHRALSRVEEVQVDGVRDVDLVLASLESLPESLERFRARVWRPGRMESPASFESLRVLERFPRLRTVSLEAGYLQPEPLILPALEELEIRCERVAPQGLLEGWSVPGLRRVYVDFGTIRAHGRDPDADAEALVLTELPSLVDLSLVDAWFGDGLCRRITEQPWLGGLERLDLSATAITDEGGRALLAAASQLDHLELRLTRNELSPEVAERIGRVLPGAEVGEQLRPRRHQDFDEDYEEGLYEE